MPRKTASQNPLSEQPKRGRGRPRKPDALTDAERAARYRARKKEKLKQAKAPLQDDSAAVSNRELELAAELEIASRRISDLSGALDVVVSIASKGKLIPADVLAGLYRLLSSR